MEQSDSSRAFTTCFRVATYFLTADGKNISSGAEITWESADARILCFAVCNYCHEITLTNLFSSMQIKPFTAMQVNNFIAHFSVRY